MIELPQITLVALATKDVEANLAALDYSSKDINFAEIKLISHYCPRVKRHMFYERNFKYEYIHKMKSIDDWNKAVIFDLPKYIETPFALLVHADGFIVNPNAWKDEWLKYDYAGSPWPLPQDDYSYRDENGTIVRVGNSVGLRSKRLMNLIATRPMEYHYGNNNEDGQIACWNRNWLENQGCRFMPFEKALYFGRETPLPENQGIEPFLFHRYWGENELYPKFTESRY